MAHVSNCVTSMQAYKNKKKLMISMYIGTETLILKKFCFIIFLQEHVSVAHKPIAVYPSLLCDWK